MIAITSTPRFRKKTYEGFQLVHLLMYVVFAMLGIHGTGWARKSLSPTSNDRTEFAD